MQVALSYIEEEKRIDVQIPYYEIQNVAQEIYEKEKRIADFDFPTFEHQYTYFKPYLDYILLHKEGRIDSFLLDQERQIYGKEKQLYYFSNQKTRIHSTENTIPYLKADDQSILLNQRNMQYDGLLLRDATCISHQKATTHDLLIDFYIHQIISQNKEIASHYEHYKQENHSPEIDSNRKYIICYLGSYLFLDLGTDVWYIKAEGMETKSQTLWVEKNHAKVTRVYKPTFEEMITARQFTKSFF